MHFFIPNTNDRKEKIKQHKTNALLQIFGITFDMLKEWNDSSKCYPRNRKIVSGKNGKITSNRCWKLWPTHQTQVWGEMQTISFLRWRLNHNSSELSHNFQNWNLDTFLPSLTVAYSSVFREKTAQMILGNPNWGIALLQVVWTENYDMRWGMIFTRISLHFLSLILLILLI